MLDYGRLIREAWDLTWRYPFLWVLGLLAGGGFAGAGGGGGNGMQWRTGPRDAEQALGPAATQFANQAAAWAGSNVGLIVAAALLTATVGIGFLLLSLVAQGGMARATAEIAEGHPITLGRAWSLGRHFFWRYVRLWLLLVALAMAIAAVVGALVATFVGMGALVGAGGARALVVLAAVIVAIPVLLAVVVGGIAFGIVVTYAQRAIAIDDLGPLAALREGWTILRAHPVASVLAWLLSLALGIGAAIAGGIALAVVGGILAAVGVGFWAAFSWSAATITYIVIGVLALVAAALVVASAVNTFFWHYWTLAFLDLLGRRPGAAAAVSPA